MYKDRLTGLYHTHFREYDPIHGRWLSHDPAGYVDGLNPYGMYAGVNGIDPYGLNKIWHHLLPQSLKETWEKIPGLENIWDSSEYAWFLEADMHSKLHNKPFLGIFGTKYNKWNKSWEKFVKSAADKNITLTKEMIDAQLARMMTSNKFGDIIRTGRSVSAYSDEVIQYSSKWKGATGVYKDKIISKAFYSGSDDVAKSGDFVADFILKTHGASSMDDVTKASMRRFGTRAGIKTLGKAVIVFGIFMAYQSAIADDMPRDKALLYAASSPFMGDLAYDVTKYSADKYWEFANYASKESNAGTHVFTLQNYIQGKPEQNKENPEAVNRNRIIFDAIITGEKIRLSDQPANEWAH